MNNVVFRKVDTTQHEEITSLFNYYIINSTAIAFYDILTTNEVVEYFDLEQPSTIAYSIILDAVFSGFCLLKQYSRKPGLKYTHEVTIYLKDEHTRKGIGQSAIQMLEEQARKNGIRTIVAGICLENVASIKLFERNGYVKCGHFKNMVSKFNRTLDSVYYQKLL